MTAASSFNKTRSRIKCFLDFCIRRGWLTGDLLMAVRPRRVTRRGRLILSPSELLAMLGLAADPRERAMLAVGMNTALRAGEIADLRISDVDLDAGDLSVRITKSHTEDAMPISMELDAELRSWMIKYQVEVGRILSPDDHLFPAREPGHWRGQNESVPASRATRVMPNRLVFVYGHPRPNKPINKPAVIVQRAIARLGLIVETGEGFHTLRRSAARAFYESRRDDGHDYALRDTSALLHHSSQPHHRALPRPQPRTPAPRHRAPRSTVPNRFGRRRQRHPARSTTPTTTQQLAPRPQDAQPRRTHVTAQEPAHHLLARQFMAIRGYHDIELVGIDRVLDEDYLWYFDYHLEEGDLTLEISWSTAQGWNVTVWDFQLRT